MSWYVAHSLDQLLSEINASAPHRSKASDGSIGDASHASSDSDHNPCSCHNAVCARDFTHDPGHGFDAHRFADWLRTRCDENRETRVKYIISNDRIASPTEDWTWRNYTGSNPHTSHVHISVDHPSGTFNDASSWEWASGGGEEDVKPTDVVGTDSDGTDLTMGEMSARLNWIYQALLEKGWLNQQLDRIEENSRK